MAASLLGRRRRRTEAHDVTTVLVQSEHAQPNRTLALVEAGMLEFDARVFEAAPSLRPPNSFHSAFTIAHPPLQEALLSADPEPSTQAIRKH